MIPPVCVDFETEGIQGRPDYPPKPVGVAIQWPGEEPYYYAWSHPSMNNTSEAVAVGELAKCWLHPGGVLFQNSGFDVDVAETFFGLPRLPWDKYHDTMPLIFLDSPHSKTISLKPSAERILGIPPTEANEVRDWLIEHQPVPGIHIGEGKSSKHPWGAYISKAPGDLVGRYACQDVRLTALLFEKLHPSIVERGMEAAYDRERRLMPILLDMERFGIKVDAERLHRDLEKYEAAFTEASLWILRSTGTFCNLDSADELIEALDKAGKIDRKLLPRTATGKEGTSKDALLMAVTDRTMLAMLNYRASLGTCLKTFMGPWDKVAQRTGRIYTKWNSVRGEYGGARTGRLSSSPSFMNIPKVFSPIFDEDAPGTGLPRCPIELPRIPSMRRYILPEDGHVLIGRDFQAQEPRVFAHFTEGKMLAAYRENPELDGHQFVADMVTQTTGLPCTRKQAKVVALATLYGAGASKLAEGLGCSVSEAQTARQAYLTTFPEVRELATDLKVLSVHGLPFVTWGGREYLVEPPMMIKGKIQTFEYRMTNHLVQGSAADITKQAVVNYDEVKPVGHRLLILAHDELVASVPANEVKEGMLFMQQAMESIPLDAELLTDGEWSGENWASMEAYDDAALEVVG
jgi:DNA polymerase-1